MPKMTRDNFPRRIITSLAGRAAYLCSNPFCRRGTIGPNTVKDRTTLIGVAAHITAASPGGPRYDINLTDVQRKDIDNGIWLCSNCSVLIDKDPNAFSVDTLKLWRIEAEDYASMQLSNVNTSLYFHRPKIEAILLWKRGISSNEGLIDRPGIDGIIQIEKANFLFKNTRTYALNLINNTSTAAIGIEIEQIGEAILSMKDGTSLINNIKPFEEKSIECKLVTHYIMTGPERAANEATERGYPTELSKVQLCINYKNEYGQLFQTLTSFSGKQPNNILR